MKVDLSKPILDLDNNEIVEKGNPITYYHMFRTALVGDFEDNKSADVKFEDFKIAMKLKNGESELSVDDIARIKTLAGNIPSTLMVGRIMEFIENIGKDE